ncbi:MAG: CarD family transcriptional regulator [Acidobacteriota bacterium]|nr:MAG: CarD family transcriptional regulator [Acidobacteriota bacterium]
MTFKVGDKVIYPNQGVGVIEEVSTRTIGGQAAQFYMVRLAANDSTVMVPVSNVENVGMRTLSSESQVKEIFEILERDFPEPEADWKTRYKENLEKMNTGEVREVAKVLRNLYYLSFKKSLSFREKRMYDRARSLVVSEIAMVKDQGNETTEKEVEEILNNSYQRTVETLVGEG